MIVLHYCINTIDLNYEVSFMIVKNYNPEKIKKDFELLKENLESNNAYALKCFKLHLFWKIPLLLICVAIAVLHIIWSVNNTGFWIVLAAIILTFVACVVVLISILCLMDGPEYEYITNEMTFAMKFWSIYHAANILSIEQDDECNRLIVITYENEHHYVREKNLVINDIVLSTEASEVYLDVENGYIVKPYNPGEKPVIKN